jgi:hypothetical protein
MVLWCNAEPRSPDAWSSRKIDDHPRQTEFQFGLGVNAEREFTDCLRALARWRGGLSRAFGMSPETNRLRLLIGPL